MGCRAAGLVAIASAALGCGRFHFDPASGDANPGSSDTSASDTAPAVCTSWGPFGTPGRMTDVSSTGPDDWGPYVSTDRRTLYMFSNRTGSMGGSLDIWVASRSDPMAMFSTPALVPNVNSTATERSPWISTDGLTLGFGSARAGGMGQVDLYQSTRNDVTLPFGAPSPIPNVNSSSDEFFSVLSANQLRLYMVSTRLGTLDVFVASRATTTGAFGTPVEITELNTGDTERHVAISSDELEIFIDSDRTGSQGIDIYRATRPNLSTPFSTLLPVAELNSAMDEVAPSLSADGSTIYYAYSTVVGGGSDAEIWFATRPCTAN